MNDFSNQQIKKSIPQIIALGERKLDVIREQFEALCWNVKDAIALHFLLNSNGAVQRFGLIDCLEELIAELQDYVGQADNEEAGRVLLLEKLFTTFGRRKQEAGK